MGNEARNLATVVETEARQGRDLRKGDLKT